MMSRIKGFTLMELMIVVAIIGIIAAIAFPSYQNSINRTHRSDAKSSLHSLAAAMERKYTENNHYCDNGGTGGAAVTNCGESGENDTGAPNFFATTVPPEGGNVTYNLTIHAVSPTNFTLKATGVGVMANDDCGDFTLTSTGVREITDAATGFDKDDCW